MGSSTKPCRLHRDPTAESQPLKTPPVRRQSERGMAQCEFWTGRPTTAANCDAHCTRTNAGLVHLFNPTVLGCHSQWGTCCSAAVEKVQIEAKDLQNQCKCSIRTINKHSSCIHSHGQPQIASKWIQRIFKHVVKHMNVMCFLSVCWQHQN